VKRDFLALAGIMMTLSMISGRNPNRPPRGEVRPRTGSPFAPKRCYPRISRRL